MNDMTMVYAMLAGVVLLAAYMHFKKKGKDFGTGPLAPTRRGWLIEHSEGMPERPQNLDGGWVLDVPVQGQGFLGTVKNYNPPTVQMDGVFSVTVLVEGNGIKAREYPDKQATCTLILQRRGDPGTARGQYQAYRWYSKQMIPLVDGLHTIQCPVNVQNMGDVMGGKDPALLQETLDALENVGIGFGSAGGRAHSVHGTAGPVKVRLISLEYEYAPD